MESSLMEWKGHVRKNGASLYLALPIDYCKAKEIEKEQIVIFTLQPDGTLNLEFRNPVMNID